MDAAMLKWLDLARIDIKNQGEGNDVKVTVVEGKHCNVTKPQWFVKDGIGYVVETSDKHVVLELECRGSGKLNMYLRGIDRHGGHGVRIPLWVDYTRLAVNKEVVFGELKPLWHDVPYTFSKPVEDGERISVEISWAEHGYKGVELSKLISSMIFEAEEIRMSEC